MDEPESAEAAAADTGPQAVTTTAIVATVLSALNVVLLVAALLYWRRRQPAASVPPANRAFSAAHSNRAFRNDSGTIRSFQSLASKFGSTGSADSTSTDSLHV